jgi:hypothetical protein
MYVPEIDVAHADTGGDHMGGAQHGSASRQAQSCNTKTSAKSVSRDSQNFCTSNQCCGSGSESESVGSVCFWDSRISRSNLTAYFQRLTLSPLLSNLLGLLSLFKEWQTLPLPHVGPVSDPSHPQSPHLKNTHLFFSNLLVPYKK